MRKKTAATPKRKSRRKSWSTAKKETYDGIEFQSNLEVYMYKSLRKAKIPFSYESKKYVLVEESDYKGECFERFSKRSRELKKRSKIRTTIYTPDFIGEDEAFIIETKGYEICPFKIKYKLFKTMLNRRKDPPILFMPKTQKDCDQVVSLLLERGFGINGNSPKLLYININGNKKGAKK